MSTMNTIAWILLAALGGGLLLMALLAAFWAVLLGGWVIM